MTPHVVNLLKASARLLRRRNGQKGPLNGAYVRRSLSTSYYALFHFLSDETANRIVGTGAELRARRQIFMRSLTHTSLKSTLDMLQKPIVTADINRYLRVASTPDGPLAVPLFVQEMARTFIAAQALREDADYNLAIDFSATDAKLMERRIKRSIRQWETSKGPADRDFKHALCTLFVLKGAIRKEEPKKPL